MRKPKSLPNTQKKDTLFADTIYSNLGEKYICVMRNQVQGAVPAQGKN